MLEVLKNQVQQKIKLRHKEIILSFFQININRHNEFCGCNYCEILEKYVTLKKYKVSLNKRYNQYEHNYDNRGVRDVSIEQEWMNNHYELNNIIKNLKLDKDQLKKII